jgi:hypothetical protein
VTDDPEIILLGQYEIPDARRVLAGLEEAQILFEIEPVDHRGQIPPKGACGRYSLLQIWIQADDVEAAQAVQTQSLKIGL